MNKCIYTRFLILCLSCSSFLYAEPIQKYRVFVDGIFDLAHFGHQRAFKKARYTAAAHFQVPLDQIEVIVGVNGGNIENYKREPVLTLSERVAQVQSFKGVDRVIPDTPLTFDDAYVNQYKIDLVMHGDDYTQKQIEQYYPGLSRKGIFKTYAYEQNISTTDILRRATKRTFQSVLRKNNLSEEEKKIITDALSILEKSKI